MLAVTVIMHGYRPQETTATGTWVAKGSMQSARSGACAALLPDGRVMITGGLGPAGSLDTSEVFGMNGSFSNTPVMSAARSGHTCMTMMDGRVLVAGGRNENGPVNTAEIYNPEQNRWSQTGVMNAPRTGHTATLLKDGRVVMIGGEGSAVVNDSIEIFDPSTDKFEFVATGLLSSARKEHAAALLPDGRILIAGGSDGKISLSSTDIFDPYSGTVEHGAKLAAARAGLSAVTLLDGRVLLAGGNDGEKDLSSAEVYDPAANKFLATETMTAARKGHLAFRLPNNNQVLLIGGDAAGNSAELFTPWQGTFQKTGALPEGHSGAAATPMTIDGVLILAGGKDRTMAVQSSHVYRFATLKTDQESYRPGATATITGSGWVPGERVALQIQDIARQTSQRINVTADAAGDISTEYQLGQGSGSKYTITGAGTRAQAQGVLQANASADLDQCANGALGFPPVHCNTSTSWVNGNVGVSKAHYNEGDFLPYRMIMDNLATGAGKPHVLTIEWDTLKGASHALDYIGSYNYTETLANACAGVTGCGASSTFPIPASIPSTLFTQIPGNFTIFGGTITGVSPYTVAATSDASTSIKITFTANQGTVVLAWGGHIADHRNWAPAPSAASISGSPFHTRLLDFDGSGGNQDRSLSSDAVTFPASITIVKNATPKGNTEFPFTITGGLLPASFSLVDSTAGTDTSESQTFSGITSATFSESYTVTEGVLGGWNNTKVECKVGNPNGGTAPVTGSAAKITPKEGEDWTCTFTNIQQSGITINKQTVAGNGSFDFTATGTPLAPGFSISTGTSNTGTKNFSNVAPGLYTVTEGTLPAGWAFTNLSCVGAGASGSGQTATINLAAGAIVTCTYVNTAQGSLKIVKNTTGGDGTFTFTVSGPSTVAKQTITTNGGSGSVTVPNVTAGDYTVTEDAPPAGWISNDSSLTQTVTVALNGTGTATFNNTAQGTLKIVKNTTGGNGTFTFTATGPSTVPTQTISTTNNTGFVTVSNLTAGTYVVTEGALPAGWVANGSTTQTVVVPINGTGTGTFNNTAQGGLIIVKNTTGGDGTFSFTVTGPSGTQTVTLTTSGGTGSTTVPTLTSGDYTVTEGPLPPGWVSTDGITTQTVTVPVSGSVTATFNNTAQGTLKIVKNTTGGNGTFTFTATGPSTVAPQTITTSGGSGSSPLLTVTAGTYVVTEGALPAGWVADGSTTQTVIVPIGGTGTATFKNIAQATLTIAKVCAGTGNATFDVNITNGSTTSVHPTCTESAQTTLVPGTYTVSEVNVPGGWNLPNAVNGGLPNGWTAPGQIKCSGTQTGTVSLAAGESKICVILNVADACIPVFGNAPATYTPVSPLRVESTPLAPANVSVPGRGTLTPRSTPPARRR